MSPADKAAIRPTRRARRVLLVLLTGAGNLGHSTIWRNAGGNAAAVYQLLRRLEVTGWVVRVPEQLTPGSGPAIPRLFYQLTPEGREEALAMLHLTEGRAS
jgi:DNA-binding IclR family transcriptional regulator